MIREVCALARDQIGLPPSAAVMEYIFGGCNSLDDYSCYLTPGKLKDLYNNIDGQFVGLGIEMKAEPGNGLLLMNVLPGSPAHESGLLAGERIVAIGDTSCLEMSTDASAGYLQGREGSQVTLKVLGRSKETREVTVTRRAVDVKSVPIAKIIDSENGIGYIQLTGFQKNTAAEMDAALHKLQAQGMRSLIWDVRGNPGGLLTAAVEVLDRFIDQGVLVSTRGRIPEQNYSYSAHRQGTIDMPLILITDGESASASEIVAGAVRDHKRGTIIGRKTYGKWSVQTIHDLSSAPSGLRLTTAKFYSPAGHTLGKIGVKPDLELPAPSPTRQFFLPPTELNLAEDSDVQKGIELLQRQLADNNEPQRSELVRDLSR
jgi:carboxyl-terminal processing protease